MKKDMHLSVVYPWNKIRELSNLCVYSLSLQMRVVWIIYSKDSLILLEKSVNGPSWIWTSVDISSTNLQSFLIIYGTYQVQTDLSVQTMQTLIWTAGSTSKGRRRGSGRGDLQKCAQSKGGRLIVELNNPLMSLGCWSGGPDWSLHGLHEKVGLHLICSPSYNTPYP